MPVKHVCVYVRARVCVCLSTGMLRIRLLLGNLGLHVFFLNPVENIPPNQLSSAGTKSFSMPDKAKGRGGKRKTVRQLTLDNEPSVYSDDGKWVQNLLLCVTLLRLLRQEVALIDSGHYIIGIVLNMNNIFSIRVAKFVFEVWFHLTLTNLYHPPISFWVLLGHLTALLVR